MLLLYPVISKSGLQGFGLKGNISRLKSLHVYLISLFWSSAKNIVLSLLPFHNLARSLELFPVL